MERVLRGLSSHRRIQIMQLLLAEPDLGLLTISKRYGVNIKTASEHTRRLTATGLVLKHYKGRNVQHALTPRAKKVLGFLKALE